MNKPTGLRSTVNHFLRVSVSLQELISVSKFFFLIDLVWIVVRLINACKVVVSEYSCDEWL